MGTHSLHSSSRSTLPAMVYQRVRNAILNGAFQPGQVLNQADVAMQLGVSASPLREALPRLAAEGFLLLHPHRGYTVARLDHKQITEVFRLRQLLECELASRAIHRRTGVDIAKIYGIASRMADAATDDSDNARIQWFDLNQQFHRALLAPAGRPHHLRALEHSSPLTEAYIRAEVRLTGDIHAAQSEHLELAKAFVLADKEHFLRLTYEHSEHTRKRLLSRLRRANLLTNPQKEDE